jgi:CHASE2 domain-containing sensor protein
MKAPIKNLDHFGLLCSLSVVVLTSLVGLMGIFRQPNEQINDALLSFGPAESNTNQVLLIPTSSDVFDQKDCRTLNRIVAALDGLAPRAIGLSFVPDAEQLSAIRNWKRNCPIVIGEDPQQTRVANQSQFVASSSRPIEFGRLDRKLDQRVYREHFATIATQQGPADSLAKRLAAIGTKSDSIASETFGIRYVGGPNSLPHVGADDVLEGNIIREMVEGRTVLIGPNEPVEIGLPTPVTRGPQRMSYLEVQGNAVHTLLTQGVVSHSDAWLSVTVLILLTVSSCQLFRQIPTRWLIAALVYTLLSVG